MHENEIKEEANSNCVTRKRQQEFKIVKRDKLVKSLDIYSI